VNCDELVEQLSALLDGALDPETERRVRDHLELCDGCTGYLQQFQATLELLREQRPAALDDETAKTRLVAAFRQTPNPPS
jgi:anti-sigma factor RsiW